MLILLPPSEAKRDDAGSTEPATRTGGGAASKGTGRTRRRGKPLDLSALSFAELTATRQRVQAALGQVSAGTDAAAALGVSANLTEEIARNTRLVTAPAIAAQDLYTGVLYDALDLPSLDASAMRRARRQIVVVSALYGALRLRDKVAPYRLSMSVNLNGVGPLAGTWRPELDPVLTAAAGRGVVVDCRSSTYVAAWSPSGAVARRWVQVRVPGATHMAKHTRGLLTRHLCQVGQDVRTPQALESVAAQAFSTDLTEPRRDGQPWILDVSVPAAEARHE